MWSLISELVCDHPRVPRHIEIHWFCAGSRFSEVGPNASAVVERQIVSTRNCGTTNSRVNSSQRGLLKHYWYLALSIGQISLLSVRGSLYLRRVEPVSPWEKHGGVSWVVSTPRSPVSASPHLEALPFKPSLPGLRALEHPFFTPSLLVLLQCMRRRRSLIARGVLMSVGA